MTVPTIAIYSLASLLMLWIGVFWLYRDYALDSFRQAVFAVRDEMFDDAARGAIDFNEPVYGMLRTMMNGSIRFAHSLNFAQFLSFELRSRRVNEDMADSFSKRLDQHMAELPASKREIYYGYMIKMQKLLLRHMLLGSPLVIVTVVLPLAFLVGLTWCLSMLLGRFRATLDRAENLAFVAGTDDKSFA